MKWQEQLIKDVSDIKTMQFSMNSTLSSLDQNMKDKTHRIEVLEDASDLFKKEMYGLKGISKFLGFLFSAVLALEAAHAIHLF
jgi:hypothetical protein